MHIAILDDDPAMREQAYQALSAPWQQQSLNLRISTFAQVSEFTHAAMRDTFDLAILDWELPDGNGLTVLRWLRSYLDTPPPIIMLTVRTSEQDVVAALASGADDFVNKPFRPRELAARAMVAMRRRQSCAREQGPETALSLGNIRIDTQQQCIYRDGRPVKLTHQEYRLAFLLFTQIGKPLARAYLYEYVWGRDERFSSRTLDVHIYRLRQKLGLTPEHGWRVNAIYGYGYRLQEALESEA